MIDSDGEIILPFPGIRSVHMWQLDHLYLALPNSEGSFEVKSDSYSAFVLLKKILKMQYPISTDMVITMDADCCQIQAEGLNSACAHVYLQYLLVCFAWN